MESLKQMARKMGLHRRIVPPSPPAPARDSAYSMIFSEYDEGNPLASRRLVELALGAAERAFADASATPGALSRWPGEYPPLLGGLVAEMRPRTVIISKEATPAAEAAARRYLEEGATLLRCDLADAGAVGANRAAIESSDLIVLDGAKDGKTEQRAMDLLAQLHPRRSSILLIDGTRLWPMLAFWRGIAYPKLDVTSFANWQGTGLVELA